MEVLYPRCAGLDVHNETVVAGIRLGRGRQVRRECRTFGTTTRELLALLDSLDGHGITHVAMESTGVYWKPVWHVSGGARHPAPRQRPRDPQRPRQQRCERHHLDRRSPRPWADSRELVPPAPIQALRDLTPRASS